ncbi:MAG TPA: hypothetical protein VGX68_23965 [Thermoanaerobaculia bacterium]|jgi:hypothetical protein|nr:hypothetical protein [Thermoanaerobaculia bacterium]
MSDIRERVATHRQDALVLLQEMVHTATLQSRYRLVVAIGHLARAARVLLADELNGIPEESKQEKASALEVDGTDEDATPVEGISPNRKAEKT